MSLQALQQLQTRVILSEAPAGAESKDPYSLRTGAAARSFFTGIPRWLVFASAVLLIAPLLRAADAPAVSVKLSDADPGPHEMADTTRTSIETAYARAWDTMAQALGTNRADRIDAAFLGTARDNLAQRIADQKKLGMTTRLVDHGHKVDILFYSPEGMSMQLRDTAQLEWQVLDGGKVVHAENVTQHYIVVLTPTEVTWKVRVLQEAP